MYAKILGGHKQLGVMIGMTLSQATSLGANLRFAILKLVGLSGQMVR